MRVRMSWRSALAGLALGCLAGTAVAQDKEQFFPVLSFRTGPYAPNGTPVANGMVDYMKMVNARDGGINGVKITYEECEYGYATDRGVECYERLKKKGPTGATLFQPISTGVTFALTDKAYVDKIPIVTVGYGRADAVDGAVFKWNFPLYGTYWDGADILVQHIGKKEGGLDKLKGKKIALVYHDSPYGKEPIPVLQERAKMHGFELLLLPVTAPGAEQKATWLQVRQQRPDYVFLWGWGVMNSTAIKEAVATGYPREKMYGVWWSGAEPDVTPAGEGAKGYNSLVLQFGNEHGKVHDDVMKFVHDKGQGTGPRDEVGTILYNRGMLLSMLAIEAVKKAQTRYGKRPLTGEEVRWGLENLSLTDAYIKQIGWGGMLAPLQTTCVDHAGAHQGRIHTWDGKQWKTVSGFYEADQQILKPMVKRSAKQYADEKKIEVRDCAKEAGA